MSNVGVKQQSVIVNFNPSFMNGKAYDFKQNFNRELVIDKNAEVMLYNASLTRKPIAIGEDTFVSIVIDSAFPKMYKFPIGDDDSRIIGGIANKELQISDLTRSNIQALIPKGTYTRQKFLQTLADNFNDGFFLDNVDGLYDNLAYVDFLQDNGYPRVEKVLNNLNYRFAIIDDENGLFYGLTLDTSIVSQGTFRPRESLCVRRMTCDHGEVAPIGGAVPTAASGHNMALESSLQKMTTQTSKATGNDIIIPVGEVADATKFEYYCLGDSPLLPVSGNRNPIKNYDTSNISFFEWSFDFENVNTNAPKRGARDTYACCVMTNDYLLGSHNDIAPNVDLATFQVNPNLNGNNGDMPIGFFGLYERLNTNAEDEILNSEVVLFENEYLQQADGDTYRSRGGFCMDENARYERKFIFQNRDGNTTEFSSFKFIIYCVDTGSPATNEPDLLQDGSSFGQRKYYYQLLGLEGSGLEGSWTLLYDQRNSDSYIPPSIMEDGSLAKMVDSARADANYENARCDVGLKPLLCMKNPVVPSTNDPQDGDFFFNPVGSFALTIDYHAANYAGGVGAQAKDIFLNRTIDTYVMQSQGVLRNVLGIDYLDPVFLQTNGRTPIANDNVPSANDDDLQPTENRKNPNIFQSERGFFAGYTDVYSDLNSYNIEIQSLPIKTYNTTSRQLDYTTKPFVNPAGAIRPVVFNVPTLIDGTTTNINSVYINKEVKPTIPKFISLDNAERIKLNTLEIKIVRANTNEEADEIVDCNLELIIKNNT